MEPTYTPDQVKALLTQAAREFRYREFRCGEAVMAELEREIEAQPRKPADFYGLGVVADMTAVPIILDFPLSPYQFQLIRHDNCKVEGTDVNHSECPVTEGVMDGEAAN